MDQIQIRDLKLKCVIGVRERERKKRQTVVVNLSCYCDLDGNTVRDDLNNTLDYSGLSKRIKESVRGTRFYLIETLAEMIASICLKEGIVEKVVVNVAKPGAVGNAAAACVELVRQR
jgi:dihydroneopterin aldolase/D-erythro-7,8-dihydroneopterin triphosphate epimerase